jgi:hypothetical protein
MKQKLVEPQQQQFAKLWQMFDDCIKTNKFIQVKLAPVIGDKLRCAMGMIMSYTGVVDESNFINYDKYNNVVRQQYDMSANVFNQSLYLKNIFSEKAKVIENFKNDYKSTGIVDTSFIKLLNDYHNFSFEDFRDLFKEMDV